MSFGGVEFFAEMGDDDVVGGVGLAGEFDAQFACGMIWAEVDVVCMRPRTKLRA